MFKDIIDGNSIYVLDIDPKTGMPEYYVGTLVTKSSIRSKMNNLLQTETEFDITVEICDGVTKEFCGVNPNGDYAISGRYRISGSKSNLQSELQRVYDETSKHVSNFEFYKSITVKCEQIMGELGLSNSNYDLRMKQLEAKYDSITASLKTIMDTLAGNPS
jgi:hypothetical protein